MHSVRETQSPRTLTAADSRAGRRLRDPETAELMISPATRLPLNPDDATHASPNPAVEGLQLAPLAEAEVAGPSPQVWDQLADHPLQGNAPMSPRQLAHPVFEPDDCLVGDASPELRFVPHREPEE